MKRALATEKTQNPDMTRNGFVVWRYTVPLWDMEEKYHKFSSSFIIPRRKPYPKKIAGR